jgi:hypothetical protein
MLFPIQGPLQPVEHNIDPDINIRTSSRRKIDVGMPNIFNILLKCSSLSLPKLYEIHENTHQKMNKC